MQVVLTQAPAEKVFLNITVDTACCTDALFPNNPNRVKLSTYGLTFTPWNATASFKLNVTNWNFGKGSRFKLQFSFSGPNAASYQNNDMKALTVDMIPALSRYAELTVFIDKLSYDEHSY